MSATCGVIERALDRVAQGTVRGLILAHCNHALAQPGPIGLGVGPQDRVTARYLLLAGIDIASVPGIAEPDAALAVNGQVVRGVEWLAVQAIHDGRCRTIGLEAHNGSSP